MCAEEESLGVVVMIRPQHGPFVGQISTKWLSLSQELENICGFILSASKYNSKQLSTRLNFFLI